MKIAIIDADLIGRPKHRFPNLACLKLSAYYKSLGYDVELKTNYENLNTYDEVKISKVFTDTYVPLDVLLLFNVEYGGTGFFYDKAPSLPYQIEHIMPDYHLYDDWVKMKISEGVKPKELTYYIDWSIGSATKGCVRQCSFCVNKNYKSCNLHSPVKEFLDDTKKYICLLDDNVFSCKDWKSVFEDLKSTNKSFQFKQGLDERLLTDEKCDVLFNQSKWIGDYIFAFDNIKDAKIIEEKLKLIRKYTNKVPKFYVFCGFNHSDPDVYTQDFWKQDIIDIFKRIEILMKYKCLPYIMRYKDYELSPYRGHYINLARWCNQPSFFKKKSLREFCQANQDRTKIIECSAVRYMKEIERDFPDIAIKYFDMKDEDLDEVIL